MHNLTKENTSGANAAGLGGVESLRIGVAWDVSSRGHGGITGLLSRKAGADLDLVAVALDEMTSVKYGDERALLRSAASA